MTEEDDKKTKNKGVNDIEIALDSNGGGMDNVSRASVGDAQSDSIEPDVHFESEEEIESPTLVIKKLRDKNRVCEKERKEYLDGWQRMKADFANARKDEEARRGELVKFASEGLVEDLLPVLDSFSSAFANKEAWEKVDSNWRKGVEYIYNQFYTVLESRGLASLGSPGEKFDPRIHTAIDQTISGEAEQEGTVAEVVHRGYRFHNKVIRPASVKVFGHKE